MLNGTAEGRVENAEQRRRRRLGAHFSVLTTPPCTLRSWPSRRLSDVLPWTVNSFRALSPCLVTAAMKYSLVWNQCKQEKGIQLAETGALRVTLTMRDGGHLVAKDDALDLHHVLGAFRWPRVRRFGLVETRETGQFCCSCKKKAHEVSAISPCALSCCRVGDGGKFTNQLELSETRSRPSPWRILYEEHGLPQDGCLRSVQTSHCGVPTAFSNRQL